VDDAFLLEAPWPPDLDPATVPFRKRTVTILRRMGYFDDWSRFNPLTEAEVLSWWNAGVGTVADIRDTGNEAIRRYHERQARIAQMAADLDAVVSEPWARHIWWRDPRFAEYVPKADGTVHGSPTPASRDQPHASKTASKLPLDTKRLRYGWLGCSVVNPVVSPTTGCSRSMGRSATSRFG
jgi:hypothetical protein